jgi:hypothetical protein
MTGLIKCGGVCTIHSFDNVNLNFPSFCGRSLRVIPARGGKSETQPTIIGLHVRPSVDKRSNSGADFGAFRPLSPLDARFRQNAWQFGALNRVPK